MSTVLSCSNCFFWVTTFSGTVYGECRRHYPTVQAGQVSDQKKPLVISGQLDLGDLNVVRGCFPITVSGHWCGEWQDVKAPWNMLLDPKLPPRS